MFNKVNDNLVRYHTSANGILYQHNAKMVIISGLFKPADAVPVGWATIATAPVGYRPSDIIYFPAITYNPNAVAVGRLQPTGAVEIYITTALTSVSQILLNPSFLL